MVAITDEGFDASAEEELLLKTVVLGVNIEVIEKILGRRVVAVGCVSRLERTVGNAVNLSSAAVVGQGTPYSSGLLGLLKDDWVDSTIAEYTRQPSRLPRRSARLEVSWLGAPHVPESPRTPSVGRALSRRRSQPLRSRPGTACSS